jgi:uncharacterized membrane protein YfhO
VPLGTASVRSYEAHRVVLEAQALAPSVLVLADAYYSGWHGSVDGQATPILPANHAFRAVALAPGTHEVVFEYRTPHLLPSAVVSLLSALACVAVWRSSRRR